MKIKQENKHIIFEVNYNNVVYKLPNCRLKIDENGGVTTLIKYNGKWICVKGKVKNMKF